MKYFALVALALAIGAVCYVADLLYPRHCDTRDIPIGATRADVLKVCGSPTMEWNSGGGTYKFAGSPQHEDPVTHWMTWRDFASGDTGTLKNNHVDYTSSD